MSSVLFGFVAILLWGSLATLGRLTIHLPPFYILGVSFLIGSLLSLRKPREMFSDWRVFLWGVAGYFGYHFFLFYSFRFAPAIEANLINYLWPMLMVLLTPVFFQDQRLRWYHIFGGVLALLGSILLVSRPLDEISVDGMKGYLLALGAAITWPVYSLGRKKLRETTVWSIGGTCFGAGVLCLLTHAWIEPRVILQSSDAWIILLMGLGPFGIAFYAWDRSMAVGNPKIIGALAYLTPVISTLGLVLVGGEKLESSTLTAMVLIIGGASLGLLDFLPSRKSG